MAERDANVVREAVTTTLGILLGLFSYTLVSYSSLSLSFINVCIYAIYVMLPPQFPLTFYTLCDVCVSFGLALFVALLWVSLFHVWFVLRGLVWMVVPFPSACAM